MIVTRTFNWTDGSDNDIAMEGWLPAWFDAKNYEPSGGLGVAHDMLEHRRSDTGEWHQELMAFGSVLYVRVIGGNASIRLAGPESLCEELARLYSESGEEPNTPCLPMGARTEIVGNGQASEWISRIVAGVKNTGYFYHEEKPDTSLWGRWIAHGYRQTQRRLGANPFMLAQTFGEIRRKVDEYKGTSTLEYPGCQLVIKADLSRAYVETRLIGEGAVIF